MNSSRSTVRRSSGAATRRWPLERSDANLGGDRAWRAGLPRSALDALRRGGVANADIARTALHHGHELLLKGFTASQVVHDYGDVCQAITELAVETSAPIRTDEFRLLNQCLDDAIAGAVTEFGRAQNQSALDSEVARGNERAGFLAHELRNLLNTATIAFEVLKTGNVGVGGSTGAVLQRNLQRAGDLIRRSLAEVRFSRVSSIPSGSSSPSSSTNIAPAAALDGSAVGIGLRVLPIEAGVEVEADREVLAAVLMNLLQNAFKFTHRETIVVLQVKASAERVLIEVHDECGGLPGGNDEGLFRPGEQRGADRTGLGLGLAFSRWAVEANHGRIYARSVPDKGCVFTIDMPRILASAASDAGRPTFRWPPGTSSHQPSRPDPAPSRVMIPRWPPNG